MDTKINNGFTIIETMLFFAVAAALAAAVLAGSSVAINEQRYRDSVNTLKSFIQQQYNATTNASNSRSGAEACTSSAVILETPVGTSPQRRGSSNCILMGRFIAIDNTGKKITVSNVIGYRDPLAKEASDDLTEVKNYTLTKSTIEQETTEVAWGASVVKKGSSQATPVSILILRSPLSGSIMTYATLSTESKLQSMLTAANTNKATDLCVSPPGGVLTGSIMAVRISAYATSQGAVQVPLEGEKAC